MTLLHFYPYVLSVFKWLFIPYNTNASNVKILILCILQEELGGKKPNSLIAIEKGDALL